MDTSDKQIKHIILNRIERCNVCHHSFGPEEIHVVSRGTDLWMMVVECIDCHARNFVAAVLNDGDPDAAKIALRRLSESEQPVAKTAPQSIVDIDDVLSIHEFLDSFDGDFLRLFRKH